MQVKVLGAAKEVGRSGFLVNGEDGTNFLLDYGVLLKRDATQFPLHVRPRDINSVVITHAHLDHSGFVPSLFVNSSCEVYATPPTLELSLLLIHDMLKLQKSTFPFDIAEVNNMIKNSRQIGFRHKITKGENGRDSFQLLKSGHVAGGSAVLVESGKKRMYYTGDINPRGSRMISEADLDIGELDLLVTESTYSQSDQMPRKEAEESFIEFAYEVIDRKGVLFVPAFSVERSQEIACVLKNANFKHKVVMDGMALKVNEILLNNPDYLRDSQVFKDSIKDATMINKERERKNAVKEPCVIISPAGMLVGGNAVYYIQQLAMDKKNGIALVSYQGEKTPGKKLLDEGVVSIRGKDVKSEAQVKQFEFSGHADRTALFDFIKNIKGNPKVLTVHGDADSCETFAKEIREQIGFDAHAPELGETVSV